MPIVESSILINQQPDKIFSLAQDYDIRLAWDPFLRDMKFLNGASEANIGVHVWVNAKNGLTMEVEYTSFKPPKRVAMDMVKGPFFLKNFAGTWRFDQVGSNKTKVLFKYSFKSRWKVIQYILDPFIQFIFLRDIKARLHGLKYYVEETDVFRLHTE